MDLIKNNKTTVLFLSAILIIINAIKAWKLTAMSLWHDESFSALLIQYDLKEMIHRIGLDVHPPFYYLLLKGWAFLFTDSLFSIRMFSVFFGILTVLALYVLINKLFRSRKLALFSSILLAFSSFQIQYDMEARMYTLGVFLLILSCIFLFNALNTKKWSWWILYSLAITAGIYTHYYIIFWILAQGVFILYWMSKESGFNIVSWLKSRVFHMGATSYILTAILFLPWLKVFLQQLSQVQENYWIPGLTVWSIPNTFLSMTSGGSIDPDTMWHLLIGIMVLAILAVIYFLVKTQHSAKWLLFSLLLIPFLTSVVVSFKTSIYLDRYFIFTLPFYLTILAGAVILINKKIIRNILIFVFVMGSLVSFPARWQAFNIAEKPGMATAAEFLNENVEIQDRLFIGSSFVYFTFKYYNLTGVKPLLYAPGELLHYSGTALLNQDDIITDFTTETKKGDIIWIINTTGFGNYKPEIPENWKLIQEKGFEDTYDYRGWIVVEEYKVN